MPGKISLILADDEALSCEALEHYLKERQEFELLHSCEDGKEALQKIIEFEPDFVFLDIEMPEISGLEIAQQIQNIHIVFITAYEHYAVKAFEENAVDHILKPIHKKRFDLMLDRVVERYHQNGLSEDQHQFIAKLFQQKEKYLKKITIKRKGVLAQTQNSEQAPLIAYWQVLL